MHSTDDPASATRPRLTTLLAEAAVLFLALRTGLSLLGAFVATQDVPSPCHFEEALAGWRTMPELLRAGPAFPLFGVWERWDACWYMKIATYGYEPGERSVAFFPLLPAAVRLLGMVTSLPYPVAGLIVAGVAYIVGTAGLLRLVGDSHGLRIGRRTVLLLSVFPAAFFLFAPFTESLFLAAAVWTLILARERRWLLAAACATLAALTRAQGAFLAIPLAWEAFLAVRRTGTWDASKIGRVATSLTAVLAPVAVFVGYGLVALQLTGETPYDAQSLWGGTDFHPPWALVAASVEWIFERGDGIQALNLVALLGSAALLSVGWRRIPLTYSLYAWPPLLLVATRIQPTPLTSTTRYVLVLFPVFVVAALLLDRPALRQGWLVVSLLFLGALATMFLQGDFVA